jgi:hypothetical protein
MAEDCSKDITGKFQILSVLINIFDKSVVSETINPIGVQLDSFDTESAHHKDSKAQKN